MRRITATGALVAVNAAIGLALTFTGYGGEAVLGLSFIPARASGFALPPDVSALPVLLTPLGSTLIHLGLLQIVISMLILLIAGTKAEEVIGLRGMLLLYALGAYAAAAAFWIEAPHAMQPLLGSFGATSALIGACAMLYQREGSAWIAADRFTRAAVLTAAWAALNAVLALAPGGVGLIPGWTAPVGSFVLGLALARPLARWHWRSA